MAKTFRTIPIKLDDTSSEAPVSVQLLRCGEFSYFGEDLLIVPEMLDCMKRNFDLNVRKTDLAIDYAHDSHLEAAAWIKTLSISADGQELWAEVEWTPKGKEKVMGKEYRYLSADFMLDYVDNETEMHFGCTLMGAGLTNRPFVKGMQPIMQLSELGNKPKTKPEGEIKMDELKKENEELKAAIEQMKSDRTSVDTELADLRKKLGEMEVAKELAEKNAKFEVLLSEGKACPAQKEAFIAGDFIKFAELAAPFKTNTIGHGEENESQEVDMTARDAAQKLLKLAEKEVQSGSAKDLRSALIIVRKENKELAELASGKQ